MFKIEYVSLKSASSFFIRQGRFFYSIINVQLSIIMNNFDDAEDNKFLDFGIQELRIFNFNLKPET